MKGPSRVPVEDVCPGPGQGTALVATPDQAHRGGLIPLPTAAQLSCNAAMLLVWLIWWFGKNAWKLAMSMMHTMVASSDDRMDLQAYVEGVALATRCQAYHPL